MRSWCDLSYREKCKIRDGEARSYSYQCHSFRVKTKVKEGIDRKDTLSQESNAAKFI